MVPLPGDVPVLYLDGGNVFYCAMAADWENYQASVSIAGLDCKAD
jgi:hypothetical protein